MSYYRDMSASGGQGGSFIQGEDQVHPSTREGASGQRAMCASCAKPFRKGERVFWRTHMSPSRMYQPVKVGVCQNCVRDEGDIHANPQMKHVEIKFEKEKREALKRANEKERQDAQPDWKQKGNEEYRQNVQKYHKKGGRRR